MIPAVTRSLFLPTLSTRKSERQWGQRQGQEVGRAERAEKEERLARPTSCPQDTRPTLWPGNRPFPQSCAAAGWPHSRRVSGAPRLPARTGTPTAEPGMVNNGERTRRLLTTDPIPLESPGALGYSPSLRFSPSLRSPIYAARRVFLSRSDL